MKLQKHRWPAVVLLAVLLAGCSSAPGDSGFRPVLSLGGGSIDMATPAARGKALLAMGQYGLAIEALQSALADEPDAAGTLNALAVAYDKIGRHDLADRYFAESLARDPRSVATLNNWGYSRMLRGDNALALALLGKAVGMDAGNPIAAANLALAEGGGMIPNGQAATVAPAGAGDPASLQQAATQAQPVPAPARGRITVLRQVPSVVRMAWGVQLLITQPPPTVGASIAIEPAAPVEPAVPDVVADDRSQPVTLAAAMPVVASAPVTAVEILPLPAVPPATAPMRSAHFRAEPRALLAELDYGGAGPVPSRGAAASNLWTLSYAYAGPTTAGCRSAAPHGRSSGCAIAQLAAADLLIAAAEFAAAPGALSLDALSPLPLLRRENR